jgi:hypothetical protein
MVIDDGYVLSLTLGPPQEPAIPVSAVNRRYIDVTLCRRKRSFWAMAFLFPLGSRQKQSVRTAVSLGTWWPPVRVYTYLHFRLMLVLQERQIKGFTFREAPSFKFIWADSGNDVALLLNDEPWAFVCESGVRYSKGVLRSRGLSNTWDQKLFERIFPNSED